ncbi:MAG: DUF1634 domain-containing protein [Acidobacteria bacterium]|nr:DUF1634 domain-containing protein [Acidobacteriota bacterium]
MTDRLFQWNGRLSTALMAVGLVTIGMWPDAPWAAWPVYLGLLMLILTPVSRVVVATARYARAGDRLSALLTVAILVVIALSAWAAAAH